MARRSNQNAYHFNMATTLNIKGMHCASCVGRVESALKSVEGVEEASVNLALEKAKVKWQGDDLPPAPLLAAVEQAGFSAKLIDDVHVQSHAHHESDSGEKNPWRRRVIVGVAFSVPILILGMTWMTVTSAWIQLALSLPVMTIVGWPFIVGGWRAVRRRQPDMDTLVALGSSVAFVYSVYLLIAVTASATGESAKPFHVYFETAAIILTLIAVGKMLEAHARSNAAGAIRELMNLQPAEVVVNREGQEETIPARDVKVDDVVIVKPGDRIAVDGVIEKGQSTIDQAMLTGEPMPVAVNVGDDVVSGTLNLTGRFEFRATVVGRDTVLSQIVDMVNDAQNSKANIQRIADSVAGWFVQAVMVVAVLTLLGWGLLSNGVTPWQDGLFAMIAVLIVACPCAMGLATPAAIMVGTGLGAKQGILIKDAAAFERAGKLTHVVLDKTGTLTQGRPVVQSFSVAPTFESKRVLQLAASVEAGSEHPLAQAIIAHAKDDGVDMLEAKAFESFAGDGVRAEVDGQTIHVGKAKWLRSLEIEPHDSTADAVASADANASSERVIGSTVEVAVDGQHAGRFVVGDPLRVSAVEVVSTLRTLSVEPVLLTGDNQRTADHVAEALGIESVYAEVVPKEKKQVVNSLQSKGHVVAMVGDGINDAPALASADVGIAIGAGTDIAKEAGHIVLVGDDLRALPRAIRLSRATMTRIRAGLFWAFFYNTALIPLAAFGVLQPMWAAAAMALSSVSVVLNAIWLRRQWKP